MPIENFKIKTETEDNVKIPENGSSTEGLEYGLEEITFAKAKNARENLKDVKDGIHVDRAHLMELSDKIFKLKNLNDKFIREYEEFKSSGGSEEELRKLEEEYLIQKKNFELL